MTKGERRATLIIVDGARPDVFAHLLAVGDLPNISRYLLETGGVPPATTVFPSTTGVAYLPFLTGCYPGTCDVPGIRWLDVRRYRGAWWRDRASLRSYCGPQSGLFNHDVDPDVRSLFDLIDDAVALASPFTRGLKPGRDLVQFSRHLWGTLAHYTGRYGILERAAGRALTKLAPKRHRFVFAVFPGVDGVTHFRDPWHPTVLDLYRQFDTIIGQYADAGGFEGDQLTLIASDHGLSRVDRHTDIALALEDLGVPTLRHPVVWRKKPRVAVMVSGNGSAQVYLRPGVTRQHRFDVSAIEAGAIEGISSSIVRSLASLPGIAMVVGQEGKGVRVITSRGRASLVPESGSRIRYTPEANDVLGLGGPAVRTEREWLAASIDGSYPDAPAQLLQLFRSARTGDLAVISEPGTDLRLDWEVPEHRSGHGSLIAEHMRCLVVSNQPLAGPVRTVDLFPVILEFLGIPTPEGIDGVAHPVLSQEGQAT